MPTVSRHLHHDHRNSQLFIDAGPQGALTAGHGHADALSIQLITDGRPILIDPGTFCYVCPERDRFRGTAAHNTLQVDGRDQAQPERPLRLDQHARNHRRSLAHRRQVSISSPDITTGTIPSSITAGCSDSKSKFWLVRDL